MITAVVAARDNDFAAHLTTALGERAVDVRRIVPGRRAGVTLTVTPDHVVLDGERVGAVAILDRPSVGWGADFATGDETFAAQEWVAMWLAAANHPNVTALNRRPASVWYQQSEWPIWRDLLEQDGVPVAPLSVAGPGYGTWVSWVGGLGRPPGRSAARALAAPTVDSTQLRPAFIAGPVVRPTDDHGVVEAVAAALGGHGVRFGGIVLDDAGRVVTFTTWPITPASERGVLASACAEVLTP